MVPVGTVTYSAGNTKELLLSGFDSEQEVRTLRILLICTIISTAGAFNWALADYATLANAMASRIRISLDTKENDESLNLIEWRTDAIDATGEDPFQEFFRVGSAIPALAAPPAVQVKIPVDVNYIHEALDTPNLLVISSDQVNAGAAKVSIDWAPAPGNVVFAGGTGTVTMSDAKVQADLADAHHLFVGPHWIRKSKGATAQFDLEEYPSVELLLAQESTPAVFEAGVPQLTVDVDGRFKPRNMLPTELAQHYGRTKVKPRADLTAVDITNNALGGGTGSVVSPIRWPNARVRAAEYELPFYLRKRKVEFSSGAFAYQFLTKRTQHIQSQEGLMRAIMGAKGVGGAPGDLAVRGFGGGDNNTLSQFKGRVLRFTGS